jgi:enediyne biosynthesis protein E4
LRSRLAAAALALFLIGLPVLPSSTASHAPAETGVVPIFTNITLTAGLGSPNTALNPTQLRAEEIAAFVNGGKGAAWFDYDRDGWQDVIITGVHKREVYRNNGDETFTDVTNATGLQGTLYGMGVITPDWNNDGFPDVVVANWFDRCELFINNGNGTFRNVTKNWNFLFQGPSTGLAFGDLDGDGWGDLYIGSYYKRPVGLFRNLQGRGIEEVTGMAGLKNLTAHTFQPLIFDYDNDGDLDIFESNDFGPDSLYRNEGTWVFTDVSEEVGVAIPAGDGMGAAIGDVNGDGFQDIFVTNFGPDYWFVYDPVAGNYTDMHFAMNVTDNDVGWGVETMDFNNDGFLDAFVADGRVIAGQVPEPDKFYINRGDGTFLEAGGPAGVRDFGINRGSAAVDFNKDGQLDLWVASNSGNSSFYRNEGTGNHWLEVALQGVASVRDAVGARLTVEAGGRNLTRVVHMGSSYLSQDSLIQHFGLGGASTIDRLTVEWPSGAVQVLGAFAADQILNVVEHEDIAPVARAANLSVEAGVPLTLDGTASTDNTGVVAWTWTFAAPYDSLVLSGAQTDITFYEPMTFEATLAVTDGFGNAGAANFTITVRPAGHPLVYAGPDLQIAQGDTVNFTGVLKGPGIPPDYANTTFRWNLTGPPGLIILPGRNVSYTFDVPGIYSIELTGADPFGQVGSDTMVLTVGDNLAPVLVFTPPDAVPEDTLFTLDASASFDNDPLFPTTGLFYWRLQGAAGQFEVHTGATAEFSLRDPGPARFDLEVNDSSRNLVTRSFVILAIDGTPPTADGGSDRVTSAGSRVRLDGSNSWDNDPGLLEHGTFEWTFTGPDGAGRAFGPVTEITAANPGVTHVRLNVRDPSGNGALADDEFNITAIDTTKPRLLPQPDITVAFGWTVTLAVANATDNDPSFPTTGSFSWSLTDGNLTRTLTGALTSYTFTHLGSWPVTLLVADAAGNYERTSFTVTVEDRLFPTLSASVAANALVGEPIVLDATNCTDDVRVVSFLWSINSSRGVEVINGAHLRWTFQTPGNYTVTLTIADAAGHAVSQVFPVEVQAVTAPPLPPEPPGPGTPSGGAGDNGAGAFAALALGVGAVGGAAAVLMLRRRQQGQA